MIVMLSNRNSNLWKAIALPFLFSYLINVVSFESFHQAIHHHDHSELHSAEAEADSCHRAIYHGDTSHDCQHDTHVSEQITDCDLCKVVVSRYHFASNASESSLAETFYTFNKPTSTKVFGYNFSLVYAPRGPPALS